MKCANLIPVALLLGAALLVLLYYRFAKDRKWDVILSSVIIVLGWYAGHLFSGQRDLENKAREQRVAMLHSAFVNLTNVYLHKDDLLKVNDQLESALTELQLLGSVEQVQNVVELMSSLKGKHGMDEDWKLFDKIVADVRNELRRELNLVEIEGNVYWIKIDKRKDG